MRHRGHLRVAAACVAALIAPPAGAAQITSISWDVTGGEFLGSGSAGPVTGGSVTWTPTIPLVTPVSESGRFGGFPATVDVRLTGPSGSLSTTFQALGRRLVVTPGEFIFPRFHPESGPESLGSLNFRALPDFGSGRFYWSFYGPHDTYRFTLGNEVRTTSTTCGDGTLDMGLGEQCDDGNNAPGDGCRSNCIVEICGNGLMDPQEECDDGNTVGADGCTAECAYEVCGNGVLDPREECDDGNTVSGDGCRSYCSWEGGGPPGSEVCAPEPLTGCLAAAKALLAVKERKPGYERLVARLKRFDAATEPSDFGDPVSGNGRYGLCIYDQDDALVDGLVVHHRSGSCDPLRPDLGCRWTRKGSKGWVFRDHGGWSQGVRKITALSGAEGKGKLHVQASNDDKRGQLAMPVGMAAALQNQSFVTVQGWVDEAAGGGLGVCIEATLTKVKKADGLRFKAKTP